MTDKIKITSLSKAYNGVSVFEDFSLELETGRKYILSAPSGKGKTTLFRIMCGLEKADSGEIQLGTSDIAICFQDDRLFENLSALDNILFAVGKPQLKESVVLKELEQIFTSDELLKKVADFSGGMRRRVSVLRALLAKSDLVLLDEPFAGLDADRIELLCARINALTEGKTVIIATHEPMSAKLLEAEIITL